MLVTGTVNDYARPHDENSPAGILSAPIYGLELLGRGMPGISEIAFTPLHVGSQKVGYAGRPSPLELHISIGAITSDQEPGAVHRFDRCRRCSATFLGPCGLGIGSLARLSSL